MGTLFGGRVLELMDINSSIACLRFCRTPVVTASTEPIDFFRNPIYVGRIIEMRSRVVWTGRSSMIVRSEVFGENPLSGERRLCTPSGT
ncbi:MAG: acyl-CoA thioesterase [Deinococcales bacterium]